MVIIVAPHTSWRDFVVGLAARSKLNLQSAKFLGKKELFRGPFGWLFRMLGGVPVDRFNPQGTVGQVANMFRKEDDFLLAMAPEGTRKKVHTLRTGFYHISREAGVPILMVGLDFGQKEVVISELFTPTGNEGADIDRILDFFGSMKGFYPEYDLRK